MLDVFHFFRIIRDLEHVFSLDPQDALLNNTCVATNDEVPIL